MNFKRKLDIVVISNVHLGTEDCNAKKLLNYLNSIEPKHLVLNGDIISVSQLNEKHFPKSHLKIIKKIMSFSVNGTKVSYVVGNHDEALRKFVGKAVGNISIVNKLLLEIDTKKMWIFHGDVFQKYNTLSKWLVKFGRFGYNMLIFTNRWLNSKNKSLKNNGVFEKTVSEIAIDNAYDYVVCGHKGQPKIEVKTTAKGSTTYMNCGDWVENFTALEYRLKRWKIYNYSKDKLIPFTPDEELQDYNVRDFIAAITIVKQP